MRAYAVASLALLVSCLASLCAPDEIPPAGFIRELPDAYVPGKTITVSLDFPYPWTDFFSFQGFVEETIPPGWSLDWSNIAPIGYMKETGKIQWYFDIWCGFHISIRYRVTPPPEVTGYVSFDGFCDYSPGGYPPGPVHVVTVGPTVLISRVGVTRRVPEEYSTIQGAIDSSSFGDTVIVSNNGGPYVENVRMKQGVDLSGSGKPILRARPEDPAWAYAIWAAPNTSINGLHISWATTGIYVRSYDVDISNCLITGVEGRGVSYGDVVPGRVTNCTIVSNWQGVVGHGSPDPGAQVIVANCVFRDNTWVFAGQDIPNADVNGAYVSFSCVQDPILNGTSENNIFADTMFVNPMAGDYSLRPGSPCIDAGENSFVSPGDVDIAGNPRILNGGRALRVDMGAYEHRVPPPVVDAVVGEFGLKWSSIPGKAYSIFFSNDLASWQLAEENFPASTRDVTIWLDPIGWPPPVPARFYRIIQNE